MSSTNTPGSQAPIPLTASLGHDHIFKFIGGSDLTFHGDVVYQSGHSGFYSQLDKVAVPYIEANVRIKSAVSVNLNATWKPTENISLTGYVRNLGNHRYITKTIFGSGVYQPYLNDPRTYGVVMSVKF